MAHSNEHHHTQKNYNRAFAIGTVLNLAFVLIEAGYGLISNSLALLADAGHNLSDVVTLLIAWGAITLANKAATSQYTYGFKKATILVSLFSAMLLYFVVGIIVWEAIGRLRSPEAVNSTTIIVVAAIGIVINTVTALLFMSGRNTDLNIKGAFLHMAADAAVSLGVVLSGIAIAVKGWYLLDPVISIAVALIIIISGWGLLKDSLHLSLAGVPKNIDASAVLDYFVKVPGVSCVYDLHIWAASTTENVLTAHIIVQTGDNDQFLRQTTDHLYHEFNIQHATIQIESENNSGINCIKEFSESMKCWPGVSNPIEVAKEPL